MCCPMPSLPGVPGYCSRLALPLTRMGCSWLACGRMLLKGVCSGSAAGVRAISSSTSSGLVSSPALPNHGKVKDLKCLYDIIHIVTSTLYDLRRSFFCQLAASLAGRQEPRLKTVQELTYPLWHAQVIRFRQGI